MNRSRAELPDISVRGSQTRPVRLGDRVRVAFMAWLENGTLIDSSIGSQPPTFTAGAHSIMEGIEQLVIGMTVGESKTEKIPSESAFGRYRPELSCRVSRRWFLAQKIEPQVGLGLEVRKTDGTLVSMAITGLDNDQVTLDANHPFAGKDLLVQLDLLEILEQAGSGMHATSNLETGRKRRSR
jgi:peptidylprolyl isomerase